MQYLDIVNRVLRKLREPSVTTVAQDDYSQLIGDFVNETKVEVEDAWRWNSLNQILNVTTIASQAEYVLTGAGGRFDIHWFIDDKRCDVYPTDSLWYYSQTPTTGKASSYTVYGTDSNGDPKVLMYPTPENSGEVYQVNINIPQADLAGGTDRLLVPSQPVILGAYAKAVGERGEDGGISRAEAETLYKKCLADAIALEAQRYPEYTTMRVV